jgi:hypothetical protein
MKLFLMWLLGVPVAVTSLVMAQSQLEGHRIMKSSSLSDSLRVEILRDAERSKKHE